MKFLQKLGKALMLPVAVLPICGILMGIGYRLCPATMQGGEISGVVNLIGLFLVKAGAALIDNMAILFAIGVGVGMSEKNDGTGGIAALASWLMITTLLSTGVVTTIIPSIAESATKTLAFDKIQNPFIGILAGIIGSACYNRFKDTKLPDWLSFFSGKRCVAIVSGVVSIVVSAVLLLVWPLLFGALVAIGKSIVSLDVVGAGIYAFLNRLLIPTGLHHALNNVFWFDTIGLGDLKHFWAGETSAESDDTTSPSPRSSISEKSSREADGVFLSVPFSEGIKFFFSVSVSVSSLLRFFSDVILSMSSSSLEIFSISSSRSICSYLAVLRPTFHRDFSSLFLNIKSLLNT